jgi:hypothetical protein
VKWQGFQAIAKKSFESSHLSTRPELAGKIIAVNRPGFCGGSNS